MDDILEYYVYRTGPDGRGEWLAMGALCWTSLFTEAHAFATATQANIHSATWDQAEPGQVPYVFALLASTSEG